LSAPPKAVSSMKGMIEMLKKTKNPKLYVPTLEEEKATPTKENKKMATENTENTKTNEITKARSRVTTNTPA
jgi:hypothetical protein